MTAAALLRKQLDTSGLQLAKVFEGLVEEQFDHRAHPEMMTPREIIGHLAECYVACDKRMDGVEHEWGSYRLESSSGAEAVAEALAMRGAVVQKLLGGDIEHAAEHGTDFLILHDAYHVGQMCTARLSLDSGWNAYSIYGM